MMILTEEQKRRIEQNRANALRIRDEKAQQRNVATVAATEPAIAEQNIQLTEAQRAKIAENRERAMKLKAEKQKEQEAKKAATIMDISDVSAGLPNNQENVDNRENTSAVANHQQPSTSGVGQQFQASNKNPVTLVIDWHNPTTKSIAPRIREFEINLVLISSTRFQVAFKPFHTDVVNVLKTIPSKHFNDVDRTWNFALTDYDLVFKKLKSMNGINNTKVYISEIPPTVRTLFLSKHGMHSRNMSDIDFYSIINPTISSALFEFQKAGVKFGISRNGRVLIADDMGLGKSIQALAIANYYQNEWPLLIVCPASVKYVWKNQIERFLPSCQKSVYVLITKKDEMPTSRTTSNIVIVSYEMMMLRKEELKRQAFYVTVFDECHMLKDAKAKRTSAAYELSKKAQRVILLSGTPALSRPSELFTQIRMIDPKIFPNYVSYAERYCAGKKTSYGLDASGQSNPEELGEVLKKIMIRRLKKDVLNDLPEKRREIIYLSGDAIEDRMSDLKKAREAVINYDPRKKDMKSKKETFMEYYVLTGEAKMCAVSKYIIETYFHDGADIDKKIIVFAHHQVVLDTICASLTKHEVKHIRIDGTTPSALRNELCQQFQTDTKTRVAVLSITAAGTGITLTAASYVVFAELYWNPSIMIQAEDRAHRVGQQDSVLVQYLLAKKSADMMIWELLGSKLKVLGEVNLSEETYRDANNKEKIFSSTVPITDFFKEIDGTDEIDEKRGEKRQSVEIDDDDDHLTVKRERSSE